MHEVPPWHLKYNVPKPEPKELGGVRVHAASTVPKSSDTRGAVNCAGPLIGESAKQS